MEKQNSSIPVSKETPEVIKRKEKVDEYVMSFNELEKKAYLIAKEHLGSSFNVSRSNGYHEWNKK
jgi:hypothetical protein